jgi:hypothetical protein
LITLSATAGVYSVGRPILFLCGVVIGFCPLRSSGRWTLFSGDDVFTGRIVGPSFTAYGDGTDIVYINLYVHAEPVSAFIVRSERRAKSTSSMGTSFRSRDVGYQ